MEGHQLASAVALQATSDEPGPSSEIVRTAKIFHTSAVFAAIFARVLRVLRLQRRHPQYYLSPEIGVNASNSYNAQEIALLCQTGEQQEVARQRASCSVLREIRRLSVTRPTLPGPQDRLLYG